MQCQPEAHRSSLSSTGRNLTQVPRWLLVQLLDPKFLSVSRTCPDGAREAWDVIGVGH
jgi:hypothetical protein